MAVINIENNIRLLGFRVTSFPAGITEAFGALAANLEHTEQRSYFGISYFDAGGNIIYHVAATKLNAEEGYPDYDDYTVQKGDYSVTVVNNWKEKLHLIKDVFDELMQGQKADETHPCIEWYKTEDELLCMIKS